MADAQANIGIGVDTSQALAAIRQLQREISAFHTSMAKGGALANAESMRLSQNLVNTINAGGQFSAGMTRISSSTESFTNALEKNKLSMGQYFRYAGGASKTFGKMFSREFNTINRVATERVKDLQTQYISMGRDANGALQSIKVRPLALDMNNLGTKVQMVAQKQQLFNQLLKQGSTNLLNFGKNTQWAGRQLMVGFTIPLTIFGATAAREFQKLEEQAVKFRRVYGDMFTTDAETEKALANIRELADEFTKYGIAVEKTVGLAAKVAQMGNVGQDLTEQVTQATRLAVLGGLEQEEALDTTISLTNAFGVAAENLAGKIAFLNAAENQTILAIEDFNEAIPKAGSVVQQLGGDVEDLAFMLTAMREGGIGASQAANAIKSSLGRMINPTAAATQKLAGFGIDIVGIVESNVGDLNGTITKLGYALDELDPLDRARAIETLFGKFQFARMSTMFSNIVKDGSQANKVLGLTANSTEELAIIAERELKRVEESPAFRLQKQMEQLKASLAPVGEEFIKAVTPIIEFGTKLFKAFNNLGDGTKQFIVALTAIAGVVAPAALMMFGLIANGVANLVKFIALLSRGFAKLSGSSRILGTGTEYLTQQQIEAASVAASLGQSHNNLIQVFTAEAAAVRNLANSYRQAVIAQGAFRGAGASVAGTAPKPRGYATGGLLKGPGTGTSDSILMYGSNGEFVVNAKATQNNLPLLEALNSGKIKLEDIPGFSLGGQVNFGNKSVPIANSSAATTKAVDRFNRAKEAVPGIGPAVGAAFEDASFSASSFGRALEKAGSDLTNVIQLLKTTADVMPGTPAETGAIASHGTAPRSVTPVEARKLAEQMPEGSPGQKRLMEGAARAESEGSDWAGNLYSEQVFTESGAANKNLLTGTERAAEWREDPLRSGAAMNESGFIDLSDPAQAAEYEEFSNLVATKLDAAGGNAVDDTRFQQIIAESVSQMLEAGANAGAVEGVAEAGKTFRVVKNGAGDTPKQRKRRKNFGAGNQIVAGDGGLSVQTGVQGKTGDYQTHTAKVREKHSAALDSRTKATAQARMSKIAPTVQKDAISDANVRNDALEQHAKDPYDASTENTRNSPHPEAFPDGADDARDYLRGQDSVLGTASDPYDSAAPKLPGLAPPPPPSSAQAGYMPEKGGMRSRIRGIGNRVSEKINNSSVAQRAADYLGGRDLDKPQSIASGAIQPVRVVDGSFEMDPKFQEVMEEGTVRTEQLDKTMARNAATNDKTSKEVAKTNKAQTRQKVAGRAFGALGAASMMAGMATQVDGQVGQVAQKVMPALMGLTAIGPMLMAMPGPLAAVVAVLGAAALSIFMLNKKFSDAQKETIEFTRAVGASKDSLQTLADYAGSVGSGEFMEREREKKFKLVDSASGKTTFGEGFVESEEGQAQVSSLKAMAANQGTDAAAAALTSQLSTAVISGILTPEQASSMAANLAYEVGNMDIGIQVRANIAQLVGPNGEDLSGGQIIEMGGSLIDQNMASLTEQIAASQANLDSMAFGTQTERNVGLGGMIAAGAGAGAATGAVVGGAIGAIGGPAAAATAAIGAVVGTLVGGVGAAVGGYFAMQEAAEEAGRATGAIVGQAMNVLDTQQEISDSLDAYYLKKIDEAKVQGDIAESLRLQAEYEEKKVELSEQEMQMRDALRTSLEQGGDAAVSARSGIDAAIETRFKDDSSAQLILPAIESSLNRLTKSGQITDTDKDLINLELATTMDPGTLSALLNFVGEDGARSDALVNVIGKFGGQFAGEAQNVLGLIEGDDLKSEIFTKVSMAGDEQEAQRILDFNREIGRQKGVINADVVISYYNDNPEAMNELDNIFERVEVEGVKTVEQAYAINPKLENPEAFDEVYFNALGEGDKEQYVKTVSMILNMPEPELSDELELWLSESGEGGGAAYAESSKPVQLQAYAKATAYKVTQQMSTVDNTAAAEDETPTPSGGGGQKENFDDLLVGLRNTRQATIDMKRGWDGMQESLQKFLDSGAVGFNGLANQMRSFGVGEGLIERITGMDPDEYEKRKGELFVFDEAGNITGTTQKLQNMGAAMNKLALGEYINNQQSFIENTNNQFTAMQMLTAQGLSFVEAYEMVQDQALATAIAMGATKEEIDELIRITEQMTDMQEKYNKISEKEQAAKAVKQTNKEFNERVAVLQKLSKEQGKYSDEEIDKVLNDANLTKIFLDPSIDPKTLKQALENARRAADLELRIKVATEEGKKGLFDELVSGVQDEFNRQESKIDIDFRLATRDDQDIVEQAQNQIAAIQYQIDDYEAQLKGIEDQEEVINEKYDDRYKALEEVAAANERIQKIRSAELDIADALSRGDIAAAARAQQELRATQAQNAAESEKEMLQKQQEAELARVRSASGSSREDLENKIKALQDEIFGVEEDSLEPAQERIRLAEIEKKAQVDALEVSGKTRDEWDKIANLTDIATQNTEEFAQNVERALALFEYFVNGAPLDLSLFGDEMTAQLESMGVDVQQEKLRAAVVEASSKILGEDTDDGTAKQTRMKEIATEIMRLNDQFGTAQGSGLVSPTAIENWGDEAIALGRRNLIKKQQELSAEFAELSGFDPKGNVSADALDRSYQRAGYTPPPPPRSQGTRVRAPEPAQQADTSASQANIQKAVSITMATRGQVTPEAALSIVRRDAAMANRRFFAGGGMIVPKRMNMGGKVKGYAAGGYPSLGSDNIPAMLTPGEFVVRKRAVQDFGVKNLEAVNNGEYSGGSVYNYSLAVNVKSDADPNRIAKTVMKEIKRVDSQRVRGNRI